jgi:hypothetical protein
LGPLLVLASVAGLAGERSDRALAEEFLQFLADWEDEQGQWQDPLEYQGPEWQSLDAMAGQDDE